MEMLPGSNTAQAKAKHGQRSKSGSDTHAGKRTACTGETCEARKALTATERHSEGEGKSNLPHPSMSEETYVNRVVPISSIDGSSADWRGVYRDAETRSSVSIWSVSSEDSSPELPASTSTEQTSVPWRPSDHIFKTVPENLDISGARDGPGDNQRSSLRSQTEQRSTDGSDVIEYSNMQALLERGKFSPLMSDLDKILDRQDSKTNSLSRSDRVLSVIGGIPYETFPKPTGAVNISHVYLGNTLPMTLSRNPPAMGYAARDDAEFGEILPVTRRAPRQKPVMSEYRSYYEIDDIEPGKGFETPAEFSGIVLIDVDHGRLDESEC
ncbi:uncharacterized protein [Diadema setosum]|uniref:uncharacterized protein n=1 Tax=Diadema setosum TaxID=31175 RepID=UPI003B3AFA1F